MIDEEERLASGTRVIVQGMGPGIVIESKGEHMVKGSRIIHVIEYTNKLTQVVPFYKITKAK